MERQAYSFDKVFNLMHKEIEAKDKDDARNIFFRLTSLFKNWNSSVWESDDFKRFEGQINSFIAG